MAEQEAEVAADVGDEVVAVIGHVLIIVLRLGYGNRSIFNFPLSYLSDYLVVPDRKVELEINVVGGHVAWLLLPAEHLGRAIDKPGAACHEQRNNLAEPEVKFKSNLLETHPVSWYTFCFPASSISRTSL